MKAKPFVISKQLVMQAYRLVKANRGAAGVDHQSLDDFEEGLKSNLYRLWNRMSSGSYFPAPVKAVSIPKKSGGERVLGVPTVADRVAQMVVKLQIEPDIEPHFLNDSYGYRPGKSALDAVGVTRKRCWRYAWVVEFDIAGCLTTSRTLCCSRQFVNTCSVTGHCFTWNDGSRRHSNSRMAVWCLAVRAPLKAGWSVRC